ncbi:MAG: SRPBCC family protein [Terriglobales bacterium]
MAKRYWQGFAAGAMVGAAAATGALLFSNLVGRAGKSRIIRLEKSLQIGRPREEVFQAWRQIENLPELSHIIREVRREGNRSHWEVTINGRNLRWDAEIEQIIPNEAIGWKSISGVRHTGRITFAPLGNDTLVHVTMNYAPPLWALRPFLAPMSGQLEGYIEAVLRDFKRALEGKHGEEMAGRQMYPAGTTTEPQRATGTFGAAPVNPAQTSQTTQHTRLEGPANPVEFTAPPEAKR